MSDDGPRPYREYPRHELIHVDVDDVKILLPWSPETAIGTQGLNGCTCIAVIGPSALLMAHISPLPGSFRDWEHAAYEACQAASRSHHDAFLRTVAESVECYREEFPADRTSAWVVFSTREEDEGYPDSHHQVIEAFLRDLGLPVQKAFYSEIDPADFVSPKGELIGVRGADGIQLHLEKRRLAPEGALSSTRSETAHSDDPIRLWIDPVQHGRLHLTDKVIFEYGRLVERKLSD